jgi:phosphopantetheinyl transferase
MPLHQLRKTTQGQLGIWYLTETESDLLELYTPSQKTIHALRAFTHPHRRAQWLATRLLLHHLHPNEQISYDGHGRPWLSVPDCYISISHNKDYIAILTANESCGIDIERIHPKIQRIASKFLKAHELERALEQPNPERLTIYWCAKETAYKVYGKKNVSLKDHITVEPFALHENGTVKVELHHENVTFDRRLQYERMNDIMLAFTV